MQDFLIHPDTKSKFFSIDENKIVFQDKSELLVFNKTPILFGKDSIFSVDDIINSKKTTQDKNQLDKSNLKNYIRRNILPSLCEDFNIEMRYIDLSKMLESKSRILIIGAGEKIQYYKNLFPHCQVVTSDVHNEFNPDYVLDGHNIPFCDNCFDLVLAAQVIEHTINPWKFCLELQRVTKLGGLLQIEAPQNYPYHAQPYDFFRFTYTGMRSLFAECEVVKTAITEGNAAMVAVSISNYLVNISSDKFVRRVFLVISRILLGWIKYLDKFQSFPNKRTVSMPKGYAFTFKKDAIKRKPIELLEIFHTLKN